MNEIDLLHLEQQGIIEQLFDDEEIDKSDELDDRFDPLMKYMRQL